MKIEEDEYRRRGITKLEHNKQIDFKREITCRQRIKLNVLMMPKGHMRLKALFKTKKLKIFKMDDQDSL